MTTIIVFVLSLCLLSTLIILKNLEFKKEKRSFLLKYISKFDSSLEKFISNLKYKIFQITQSLRYILHVQTKIIIKDILANLEEKIMDSYHARHEALMGRRELNNKGAVSFYLKKIAENKSGVGKGKIE